MQKKEPVQRKKGIYGQVTDVNGDPIIGAIIRIDGVNGGYTTDINGEYQAQTDLKEARLTVSYIGYKTITRTVKNGSAANFTMHEDTKEMQEVVVTGYQTKNKNSFTGSQVSVTRDQLMTSVRRMCCKALQTSSQVWSLPMTTSKVPTLTR